MSRGFFSAEGISLAAPRAKLPWTVCVLFYGDHPQLCRRFLDSLYRWTDPAGFHLRAGMNAVCRESQRMLEQAAETHGNVTLFPSETNLYKVAMMRRMFWSPPLETEWTVWFDDDSHVTGPRWSMDLALAMERRPDADLFGSIHGVDVSGTLERFVQTAPWYRGLPRNVRRDTGKPVILFPVGGFWAVRTVRIRETNWPDSRVCHFEDDYAMGEAMRQQGVVMADHASGVRISDAPRRAPADAPWGLRIDG